MVDAKAQIAMANRFEPGEIVGGGAVARVFEMIGENIESALGDRLPQPGQPVKVMGWGGMGNPRFCSTFAQGQRGDSPVFQQGNASGDQGVFQIPVVMFFFLRLAVHKDVMA